MSKFSRRHSALSNVAQKKGQQAISLPVNLRTIVRVYFLDGTSKVLQMTDTSNIRDLLIALKFNLNIQDISNHAIFRLMGANVRRVELNEIIQDALRDPTGSGMEVRLLFRSWIIYKNGSFESEALQSNKRVKLATTALWLAYMEANFMCNIGKYFLTEDESLMLGCLKMQAESGDYKPSVHNLDIIKDRLSTRFPNPIKEKVKSLSSAATSALCSRVKVVYARLAGKSKAEAHINYLEFLRMWCPFYGSTFFDVQCQYDDNPLDDSSSPPVQPMSAAVGPHALFLVPEDGASSSASIMRHPYNRIVKWVCHADKHIFTYWTIKPSSSLEAVEEAQRTFDEEKEERGDFDSVAAFDVRPYCDCVYLVSSQVRELEYLVKSYVHILRPGLSRAAAAPSLPGATGDRIPNSTVDSILGNLKSNVGLGELLPNLEEDEHTDDPSSTSIADNPDSCAPASGGENSKEKDKQTRRRSMLGSLLSGFGGQDGPDSATKSPTNKKSGDKHVSIGSGLDLNGNSEDVDVPLGSNSADSTAKTKSFFKSIYGKNTSDALTNKTKKKSVNFSDKIDVKEPDVIPDPPTQSSPPPPPPPPPPGRTLKQLGFGEVVQSPSEDVQSPTPDTEDENADDDDGNDNSDDEDDSDEGGRRRDSDDSDDDGDAAKGTTDRGWGWEAVDDLDSEDEGDGRPLPSSTSVNNHQEEGPDKSTTSNVVRTGHTAGRRSSVDAIRSAIFSAFRGKPSGESSEAGEDIEEANNRQRSESD